MYYLDNPLPDNDYIGPLTLTRNHVGEYKDGYLITEQFPFGCLGLKPHQTNAEEITTYKGNKMIVGYVDRKFIPLAELESYSFA